MTRITLRTIARVSDCVMRQVLIDGAGTPTYVFLDLTGRGKHHVVTPDAHDLIGDGETLAFESLPDLAECLREKFQLPF